MIFIAKIINNCYGLVKDKKITLSLSQSFILKLLKEKFTDFFLDISHRFRGYLLHKPQFRDL